MPRWLPISIAMVVLAVALSATVSAAPEKSDRLLRGPIVPGKSIGPLRLGMSEAAARRVLRRVGAPRVEMHVRKGSSTEYIEQSYPTNEVTSYTAGFLGRPGKRRLVFAMTHLAYNKTREGIGVGTTDWKLVRTYSNLRCRQVWLSGRRKYQTECNLGTRSAAHTVFVVLSEPTFRGRPPTPPRVARVLVRVPFRRA